jgi:Ca2+-binding RTX toxin-like protein
MATPSTSYIPITSDQLINGMTTGYLWSLDSSRELDFSISDGFNGEYWISPDPVAILYAAVLDTISIYANIDFNYLGSYTNPSTAVSWGSELNLSLSQTGILFDSDNSWAMGFFPDFTYNTTLYPGAPGDIYLNINSAANTLPSFEPGSQGWFLLLHEVGHTLGLKHPHDDGGTGRPTFTEIGIEWLDKDWATVMSYNDDSSWNNFFWDPATPMILDVLALQYLYGKNLAHNVSDNYYELSETNYYSTLWDAAGTDTLDASGASGGWEIYLPEVSLSTLVNTKVGMAAPIGLSSQTLVWLAGDYENVVGSQFADVIEGNLFNNFLNGGSGNDAMYGGYGNDTFDWDSTKRSGNDTMYGGLGDDTYVLDSSSDSVIELFGEGTDTIWANFSYNLTYSPNTEGLYLFGTGNISAAGNNLSNFLRGNSGNNFLSGGDGLDYLLLSGKADQYFCGLTSEGYFEVRDTVANRDGTDLLTGVERLQFTDANIALDLDGIAGKAYRIYEAALGRAPDLEGLGYWINDMDNGVSLTTVTSGFIASTEFQSQYGANPSYETYINLLYQNILNRAPDAEGLDYWLSNMRSGANSPAVVLASFSEGIENTINVAPDIANGIYYDPWLT